MYKCKQCNREFETLDKIRRHSSRVHKISAQEIYNQYVLNNKIPTCKCGCGAVPKFISSTRGYNEWIRGHIARVNNNWGHNPTAVKNSTQTRREQFKNGERKVWNDGLTKETDKRVSEYGKLVSEAFTGIRKDEYSNRMRMNRLSGKVPTLWGVNAANWKGGTSTINSLVRANTRLYTDWIFPILKEQNYTCQNCDKQKNLEVHHNKETMSQILQKFVNKTREYTFDEKREIMNEVIDYHINNKVDGQVLCRECHKKLHPSYNT